LEVIGPEPRLAAFRAAVYQDVVEQVVVTDHFPHLRVHDDAAIETDHGVGRGSARRRRGIVVPAHQVAPPGLLDVPFQFYAQRTIVPETADAAVNLARLEDETALFAE